MDIYDKRCFDDYGLNTCIIIHKENDEYQVRKKTVLQNLVIFNIQRKFLHILIPKYLSDKFTVVLIESIKEKNKEKENKQYKEYKEYKDITAIYIP